MGPVLAHHIMVPFPDLGSDGLTDGTKDTKVLHLGLDVLITSALQQTQSGGSNVELSDLVLVDDFPVAGEVGVSGSALKDDGGDTEKQRCVDDV